MRAEVTGAGVGGHKQPVRFDNLLRGNNEGQPLYDKALIRTFDYVVAPSLGAIVPDWLLVLPCDPAVNFRRWQLGCDIDPLSILNEILSTNDVERAIWFEHGPSQKGSATGCGVDYAHLHVLVDPPFSFERFSESATRYGSLEWRRTSTKNVYNSIPTDISYLVAGWKDNCIVLEDGDAAGSQYFRRVVAELVGKPDEWNYKVHQHLQNVGQTILNFQDRRLAAPVP